MIFSIFNKITNKISSTTSYLYKTILNKHDLTEEEIVKFEELLLLCDFNHAIIEDIINKINQNNKNNTIIEIIEKYLNDHLTICEKEFSFQNKASIIICGTNGSGKTTFIPKLTNLFKDKKFILAPCDTFRAAAQDQLERWKDKNTKFPENIINIKKPTAIAYTAIEETNNSNYDGTIIDTAGRLSNNKNLMLELQKIYEITKKKSVETKVILVLDGSAGQNNISQIEEYSKYVKIDGIVITKFDMSSKAGSTIFHALKKELSIFYLSHGEQKEDLSKFNAAKYSETIIEALKR